MDFWSSREIRDKERPLNVDSTFKRLSRRLLHCRSLVKIHARSNCEGYPSMDNIHQQSWATTLCPFSLRGKHTQRGLIHFLAHSRVFIHTITYHMVTHCIQICHPCLQSCQRTTTLTSILKQPPNLIFYLRQVPRTRFSINIDPSAQPNNLCTKNAQKTGEEKILSTIPSCIILSTLSSNNCSSLSFLRGFTTLCGIMRSFLVVFESKCCTTITNATERSQWIKKKTKLCLSLKIAFFL